MEARRAKAMWNQYFPTHVRFYRFCDEHMESYIKDFVRAVENKDDVYLKSFTEFEYLPADIEVHLVHHEKNMLTINFKEQTIDLQLFIKKNVFLNVHFKQRGLDDSFFKAYKKTYTSKPIGVTKYTVFAEDYSEIPQDPYEIIPELREVEKNKFFHFLLCDVEYNGDNEDTHVFFDPENK